MAAKPGQAAPLTAIPIAGTPSCPTGQQRRLDGTSQGRRGDIPPEDWIQEELLRYNVMGNVRLSSLTGTPHPIFDRKRWRGMSDIRFEAMSQSLLLASTLLEIGLPYLASWLPFPNYAIGFNPFVDGSREFERVNILANPSDEDIRLVRKEITEISEGLELHEDSRMYKVRGWWGITTYCYPRATKNFGRQTITATSLMDSRLKRDGYTRRQNTIGITSSYIDTILNSERTSGQHLCASFHLAVTLVHEIAHLIFWQDIRNDPNTGMGFEPVVEKQVKRELGLAFTSWLFGGWNPEPINATAESTTLFNMGMFWDQQLVFQPQPYWTHHYSIPLSYIETLFTQGTWDAWAGNLCHPDAKAILAAQAPFQYGQHARRAICEKRDHGGNVWRWKKFRSPFLFFDYDQDDDEPEFGNRNPPGIPPFGFHDENWTAGPSAEVYGTQAQPEQVSRTQNNPQVLPEQISRTQNDIQVQPEQASQTQNNPLLGHNTFIELYDSDPDDLDDLDDPDDPYDPDDLYDPNDPGHTPFLDVPDPHPPGTLHINVIYRGVFNAALNTLEVPMSQPSGPPSVGRYYVDWPEGVLRSLCSERDISSFGQKSELVARLEQFDAAQGGRTMPEPLKESTARRQNPTRLTFDLESSTTVDHFKQMIYEETGIPVGIQHLHCRGVPIVQPRGQATLTLAFWQNRVDWGEIHLVRTQGSAEEDPGPLPSQSPTVQESPINLPHYIRDMEPIPDLPPWAHGDWNPAQMPGDEVVKHFQAEIDRLEQTNAQLRRTVAGEDAVAAEAEYRTYVQLLQQANLVLVRKEAKRRAEASGSSRPT